jgi:hypothetical protein
MSLSRLYRDSPLGVAAGLLGGATTGAFFALGPIFAERRGLGTDEIAVFMASGTLGGFVAAWPLGLLSDRYDRRLVIIGAASAAAVSLIAMLALVPSDAYPWLLYLCVALFGGMIIPTYSLALAHLSDAVEQEAMVAASGGLLLAHGAGAAIGPLIADSQCRPRLAASLTRSSRRRSSSSFLGWAGSSRGRRRSRTKAPSRSSPRSRPGRSSPPPIRRSRRLDLTPPAGAPPVRSTPLSAPIGAADRR